MGWIELAVYGSLVVIPVALIAWQVKKYYGEWKLTMKLTIDWRLFYFGK